MAIRLVTRKPASAIEKGTLKGLEAMVDILLGRKESTGKFSPLEALLVVLLLLLSCSFSLSLSFFSFFLRARHFLGTGGLFQKGKEREGKERKGKERKGKARKVVRVFDGRRESNERKGKGKGRKGREKKKGKKEKIGGLENNRRNPYHERDRKKRRSTV